MKQCTQCESTYDDSTSFCPTDGGFLEENRPSIVNTVLDGQYQIEAMLGKGGMGAVYRARHILLGDCVAIKILSPEMRNNAEWLRRFRREGQAARRFRHPNAVTVYDLRTAADGTIYLVMEYVEGHTLEEELKIRGHFSPASALETLEPIMSVLNAAHAMGVVHRDLKPANIMIGKLNTGGEPVVKLLDLGVAKLREVAGADAVSPTALTMAGEMLGTPYYMSPEQWGELSRDGSAEIDSRADIYSLGLVLYEMVSGQKAYSGLTLLELRQKHVCEILRPLHEAAPDVPEAFSDAVMRAVAKDRSGRPATAGELAAELHKALGSTYSDRNGRLGYSGSVATEIAPKAGGRNATPARKRATVIAAAAVMIFTLVAAGSSSTFKTWLRALFSSGQHIHIAEQRLVYSLTVQKFQDGGPIGSTFESTGQEVFGNGWKFRFNVVPAQPGALYLLNEEPPGPGGQTIYNVLFPTPKNNGGIARLPTKQRVQTEWCKFVEPNGIEKLWIIWSAQSVPELDALFYQAARTVGPTAGEISNPSQIDLLKTYLKLYESKRPEVSSDEERREISVKVQGDVLVHLIKLRHEAY